MSKNILVVDDDESISSIFEFILQQAGFTVITAKTGNDCLSVLSQNEKIDLIFLDVKMPGISGLDTLREILKSNPNMLVIMMTGFSINEVLKTAYEKGAYGIIYKPFDIEEVLNIINKIFEIPKSNP
ncbi:response regulator [bacterium]|jgi:DNA-binding NtrC family response regulator|nr:response regulator [bacterium]